MRSEGLNFSSLLTQWLFNNSVSSWFGWALSLKWYFSLKFLISSFTEGIWRSCWITQFGTNHGALTMILRTLDWKYSIFSMLEMLAVPHSWHPYSQTGFRIALYICSLLSTDSWELRPRIQYICLSFASNCNLFNQMCFCQVRHLSKCRPRLVAIYDR
jgi:hypothetical protein